MSDAAPVITHTNQFAVVARLDDGGPNVISPTSASALSAAIDQAEAAQLPLVILGRDGMFSAGFDLNVLDHGQEAFADLVVQGANLLQRMAAAPIPVIVGAGGHAVAMGALMLLAADYRIGADGRFKIGLNEVSIGMTLPNFALTLAEHRLCTNHLLRATVLAELHRPGPASGIGYLDEVVDPDGFEDAVMAKAEQLSKLHRGALAATKARARGRLVQALADAIERDKAEFAQG